MFRISKKLLEEGRKLGVFPYKDILIQTELTACSKASEWESAINDATYKLGHNLFSVIIDTKTSYDCVPEVDKIVFYCRDKLTRDEFLRELEKAKQREILQKADAKTKRYEQFLKLKAEFDLGGEG